MYYKNPCQYVLSLADLTVAGSKLTSGAEKSLLPGYFLLLN